jgi:hypothetical protein
VQANTRFVQQPEGKRESTDGEEWNEGITLSPNLSPSVGGRHRGQRKHLAREQVRQQHRNAAYQRGSPAQRPHIRPEDFERGGEEIHEQRLIAAVQFKKNRILPMEDGLGEIGDKNFVVLYARRIGFEAQEAEEESNGDYCRAEQRLRSRARCELANR